jgi:hypothetical protein
MDYDALNALSNLVNQQSNRENKSELIAIRKQLAAEAKKPNCPHCGGACEKGFDRCKNCGQEVIWCGPLLGKPSQRAELEMAMQQYELEIKQNELEIKRQQTQTQLLTITYKPIWVLCDVECKIVVDEKLIGTGSLKKGATFTTNLLLGKHLLSIEGRLFSSYACEITSRFDEPNSVEFLFDRLVGSLFWFSSHISS